MKELQQASTLSSVWVNLSINSLFPSYLVPLFQNESSCDLLYENEFGLHKNERTGGTRISIWLILYREGNSEMVLRWAHTRGHVSGTCCCKMKQGQNRVKYTLRGHVAEMCSRDMSKWPNRRDCTLVKKLPWHVPLMCADTFSLVQHEF